MSTLSTHLNPYEFPSMVDFANHLEAEHGLDYAHDRDRWQLTAIHSYNHAESSRDAISELQSQLEEALGIIEDLANLHDSYIGYLVVHNNYNHEAAGRIRERIQVLRLKQ